MQEQKRRIITCSGNGYDDCAEPAMYLRHTQFAGSHPFCLFHAMAEPDFMDPDGDNPWEKLDWTDDESQHRRQKND